MNILLVASPVVSLRRPFKGGTESFITGLGNGLSARGHVVDVLAQESDETDAFQTIEIKGSPLSMCDDIHSEAWGQKYFKALHFGAMDFDKYDVVHFNSYLPILYDLAHLNGLSAVVTLHCPMDKKLGLLHALHSARSESSMYVAVSDRVKMDWERQISTPISVIHNGIDISEFAPIAARKIFDFIWVGRICAEKNLAGAVQLAQQTGSSLRIIGPIVDQRYYDDIIAPALNDEIVYLGHITTTKVREELACARYFLATASWNEPFGLAILEALAMGLIVVGFTSAVPPELRNKACVLLSRGSCIESLMTYIARLKAESMSKYQSRALAARQHAALFNIRKTVEDYERIYESIKAV